MSKEETLAYIIHIQDIFNHYLSATKFYSGLRQANELLNIISNSDDPVPRHPQRLFDPAETSKRLSERRFNTKFSQLINAVNGAETIYTLEPQKFPNAQQEILHLCTFLETLLPNIPETPNIIHSKKLV